MLAEAPGILERSPYKDTDKMLSKVPEPTDWAVTNADALSHQWSRQPSNKTVGSKNSHKYSAEADVAREN
jgi:hypothetical protein